MNMKDYKIGIIGLGNMGSRMAIRLINNGFHLNVYNRSGIVNTEIEPSSINIYLSAEELANYSDIIIMMVTDDSAVKEIIFDEKGVYNSQFSGILLNTSTISPNLSLSLNNDLKKIGIKYVDAPVLGSLSAAENGKLKFLIKLNDVMFNKIHSVIKLLGSDYRIIKFSKTAQEIKLFHNTFCAMVLGLLSKTLLASMEYSSERNEVYDALSFGALNCDLLAAKQSMFSGMNFEPLFPLKLMFKDLDTLKHEIDSMNISTSFIDDIHQQYKDAIPEYGDYDCASIFKYYFDKNE